MGNVSSYRDLRSSSPTLKLVFYFTMENVNPSSKELFLHRIAFRKTNIIQRVSCVKLQAIANR